MLSDCNLIHAVTIPKGEKHKGRIPIKCLLLSSLRHICRTHSLQTGRAFLCGGSSIVSTQTLFVTTLNSCGLNQSSSPLSKWNRQHGRSRLLYATPVHSLIVWTLSFSCLVSVFQLFLVASRYRQILSSFSFSTLPFCPQTCDSSRPSHQGWIVGPNSERWTLLSECLLMRGKRTGDSILNVQPSFLWPLPLIWSQKAAPPEQSKKSASQKLVAFDDGPYQPAVLGF